MTTKLPSAELLADANCYYANGVSLDTSIFSEGWVSYKLRINAGISFRTGNTVKKIAASEISTRFDSATKLLTTLHKGEPFYSLDLSWANAKSNETIEVFQRNHYEIIVVITDATIEPTFPPRFMTAEDMRLSGQTQCPETHKESANNTLECHRAEGHLGSHQYVNEDSYGQFSQGGSAKKYGSMFGIPTECYECGFILESNGLERMMCFDCSYWLKQLDEPSGGFVINGSHYRSDKGEAGFGGRKFKIEMDNGQTYSGGLWGQGPVPPHFISRFTNTGRFVS